MLSEKRNTICITGASSGIGATTATYFLQKGWNVAATMRDIHSNHGLVPSDRLKLYSLDVTSKPSIELAVLEIFQDWGSIEAVVNNAGYGTVGIFEAASYEDMIKQFDVNLFGTMLVTQAFLPHFRSQRRGVFINISSVAGRCGFPLHSLYNSSKFAMEGFTESLWYELNPLGVQVKLVEPGAVATRFYGSSVRKLTSMDDSEYQKLQDACDKRRAQIKTRAASPRRVAKTIYKAATGRPKKLRYPVTTESWWLAIGLRILPHTRLRSIVRRVFLGPKT